MTERRRILVTGAGGFIGGRVVEVLHTLGRDEPVAGVRRWASAARVGRLPVALVQCDVTNEASVRAAMNGCTHVIHCAVGDTETTVGGTRTVLEAARALGVRRVVHVSTIDVYGREQGTLTEDQPLHKRGEAYGDSKIDAEQACQAALAAGLELSIVRPTIVYGPFSAMWTVEFAQQLLQRPWPFPPEKAAGICNAVYVDDVVQGILRALRHPAAVGEAFNINGAECPTWYGYFERLNAAMGLPPIEAESATASSLHAHALKPLRETAKWAMRHFQPQIMALYQASPTAKLAMKRAERILRGAPTTHKFRVFGRTAAYPAAKAERLIGYRPGVSLEQGLSLSAAWLRHHGYLGG
jgi:nucleoside-diphosphate-sugar epimerase